jgi:hypothetical protein
VIIPTMKSYAGIGQLQKPHVQRDTPVKDHDASAVAVENQHKTLEKVQQSYDYEPENFSISCDPGERIIPLSDSQRCSIVRKGLFTLK